MANSVKKLKFSAAVNGKGILVVATATPGTAIHVTENIAADDDEIWLWLQNSDTKDNLVTIEFGGVTNPGFTIIVTVPWKQGLVLAIPGLLLPDAGGGALTIAAFAATANVVSAFGYVLRITR